MSINLIHRLKFLIMVAAIAYALVIPSSAIAQQTQASDREQASAARKGPAACRTDLPRQARGSEYGTCRINRWLSNKSYVAVSRAETWSRFLISTVLTLPLLFKFSNAAGSAQFVYQRTSPMVRHERIAGLQSIELTLPYKG